MDNFEKEEFYAHFGQMMALFASMVILSVTGDSVETRTMAANEAKNACDHMADDVAYLLNLDNTSKSDKEVEDFKMWAEEFKG